MGYVLIHTYMDLLRDFKDSNENVEEEEVNKNTIPNDSKSQIFSLDKNNKLFEEAENNENMERPTSPIFILEKNNKKIDSIKYDINLVALSGQEQIEAKQKFYEEIAALGKDIKLKICLKLTKVVVPLIIL